MLADAHQRLAAAAWFADEQLRGAYRQWIHEHTFEAHDGGALARDVVHYAVPFDFIAHHWFVRPDVGRSPMAFITNPGYPMT